MERYSSCVFFCIWDTHWTQEDAFPNPAHPDQTKLFQALSTSGEKGPAYQEISHMCDTVVQAFNNTIETNDLDAIAFIDGLDLDIPLVYVSSVEGLPVVSKIHQALWMEYSYTTPGKYTTWTHKQRRSVLFVLCCKEGSRGDSLPVDVRIFPPRTLPTIF